MNKAPRLTLKDVKTFRGHEGYGLNATLLLDGVKVAEVLDEGNGGCYRYYWTDRNEGANEGKVLSYLKELGITEREALDMVVAEISDEMEAQKRYRRLAKTNVLFTLPQDMNAVFRKMPHRGKPDEARVEVLRRHPNAKFIEA